jgi:signal transduction histidine kinase
LKHGNATKINIEIIKNINNVKVIITDNGIGCDNILKSNGLNGIENRINSLGGEISYFSYNNLGFGIKLFIPI